jgi:hypothetical protein
VEAVVVLKLVEQVVLAVVEMAARVEVVVDLLLVLRLLLIPAEVVVGLDMTLLQIL